MISNNPPSGVIYLSAPMLIPVSSEIELKYNEPEKKTIPIKNK